LLSFAARLLGNSAGNGPAFFSLTVETSLIHAALSSRTDRQRGDCAAWSFCANGETHFNLAQDKLNM